MMLATVTVTSPLQVRLDGSATAVPAKVVGGSSYAPVVSGRVLVAEVASRLYVIGSA